MVNWRRQWFIRHRKGTLLALYLQRAMARFLLHGRASSNSAIEHFHDVEQKLSVAVAAWPTRHSWHMARLQLPHAGSGVMAVGVWESLPPQLRYPYSSNPTPCWLSHDQQGAEHLAFVAPMRLNRLCKDLSRIMSLRISGLEVKHRVPPRDGHAHTVSSCLLGRSHSASQFITISAGRQFGSSLSAQLDVGVYIIVEREGSSPQLGALHLPLAAGAMLL